MDPPPSREESEPEPEPGSRPRPDADEPETFPPERDGPEASRPESSSGASPPPPPPPLRQQLMGACRADERLRPLVTLNVSCTAADDRLVAHLAQVKLQARFPPSSLGVTHFFLSPPAVVDPLRPVQHFEVSEVGLLARCLCVPLVSLRVGKVQRDGTLLCPTPIRLVGTNSVLSSFLFIYLLIVICSAQGRGLTKIAARVSVVL
jgi:hypothetical protein